MKISNHKNPFIIIKTIINMSQACIIVHKEKNEKQQQQKYDLDNMQQVNIWMHFIPDSYEWLNGIFFWLETVHLMHYRAALYLWQACMKNKTLNKADFVIWSFIETYLKIKQAIHVLLFIQKGNFNKMTIYSPFSKNSICFVAKTIDNKNVATGRKS